MPIPPPKVVTTKEAMQALSVGRSTIHKLIDQKKLDAVHIGRALRISTASIDRLAANGTGWRHKR